MSDTGSSNFGMRMRPAENSGGNVSTNGERDAWNQPIKKAPEPQIDPATGKPVVNAVVNGGVDDTMVDNLWNDIQKPVDDKNKPQEIVIKQEPLAKTGAEQLKEYLTANGLGEFTLSEADKAALQSGDFTSLTTKMHELAVNAHTKALSGASTLIEAKVADAVKKAVAESKGYVEGKASLEALHAAVPATKHPAIGPVAQTVMQRLLDRGATQEQAIQGVKKWSELFAQQMGYSVEVNGNRNGSFRGGQGEGSGETNWLKILSAKS